MKWLTKRFWLAVDWVLLLLGIIISLPLLVCIARAVVRAMEETP